MVDIRNRIIHGNETVSDEIIWAIVFQHLPRLKSEIENLLGEQKTRLRQRQAYRADVAINDFRNQTT